MDYEIENKSCLNCIWHDQCEDIEPCAFFDNGQYDDAQTDSEIEIQLEIDRKKYDQEYQKYIKEFSDGNRE